LFRKSLCQIGVKPERVAKRRECRVCGFFAFAAKVRNDGLYRSIAMPRSMAGLGRKPHKFAGNCKVRFLRIDDIGAVR